MFGAIVRAELIKHVENGATEVEDEEMEGVREDRRAWRLESITWSEVLRSEHTSQYPHTTSSKRILSLDESVLTRTRLRLGYHGDAFYHSQVYSEGAITPGRVMSLGVST
jgi:hypothetical protein